MNNQINDNILSVINKTPDLLMLSISERVKDRRLEKNWTQKALAAKAGISFGSYRRFESSGEISLRSLVMIAFALDMTDGLDSVFSGRTYRSIDDLIGAEQSKQRKRGTKGE